MTIMRYITQVPCSCYFKFFSLQPSNAADDVTSSEDETVEQEIRVQDTLTASNSNETSSFHEDRDSHITQVIKHSNPLNCMHGF